MKKTLTKFLAGLMALTMTLGLAACGNSPAGNTGTSAPGNTSAPSNNAPSTDDKVYEIRLASTQADGNDIDLTLDEFAQLCDEKSNGRLKITVYTGNILGDELSTTEMCQQGSLEMTLTSAGVVENFIPAYSAPSVPGIFKGYDHLNAAINGEWGAMLRKVTEDAGMVLLGCTCTGIMNMGTTTPVASFDDLKGLNIRCIESKAWSAILSAWGANPVPMAFSEVPTSLQLGAIDGCFLAPGVFVSTGIADIMKYYTHDWSVGIGLCPVMVNKDYFYSLPQDLQDIILEAFHEAEANGFTRNKENEAKNLETMLSHGVELVYSTPEQLAEMERINQEEVWPMLIELGVATAEDIELITKAAE